MKNLGSEHVWVVHGADGLDELTTTGVTKVAELKDGDITVFEVTPEDAGLSRSPLATSRAAMPTPTPLPSATCSAANREPFRDIVLLNAAAALIVGGKAANLIDGVERAARAIDSGAAQTALDKLVAVTNEGA